jgi:hypothetical protein
MKFKLSIRFGLILFALGYGVAMLLLDGRPLSQLYELSPYHRYQADALLRGQLALADSMEALQPGLVWHDGHVQHVWGMGVGIWLVPFELLWRLFGGFIFPDRLALGFAFVLLAFYSGRTGLRLAQSGQGNFGLGLMWLVLLCPALWVLARSARLIFEETVLYAIILSLACLVSIIRVALFGSRMDYTLCCVLGSLSIWVRPTHAIYGAMAVGVCSLMVWLRRRSVKEVLLGASGLLASFAVLAWTNNERFGSATEFGHRLTVSTESMVYLTRFGNPFQAASIAEASKELFGALFLSDPKGAPAFADNLFPWQASWPRWRRLDLTAFDLSYFVLGLIGSGGAVVWLWVKRKSSELAWNSPRILLSIGLLTWAVTSLIGLGYFYLFYPVLASRYLLDFSPACIGFIMVGWFLLPPKFGKCCLPLLAGWLVFEIGTAKVMSGGQLKEQPELRRDLPSTQTVGIPLNEFGGCYTSELHPVTSATRRNGVGWESGFAASVVVLAIDRPEFLELRIEERRGLYGETPRKDSYQAQIDNQWLLLQEIRQVEDGQVLVRFDIPDPVRARRKDEILFLSFTAGFDEEDRNSERLLYQVRWR